SVVMGMVITGVVNMSYGGALVTNVLFRRNYVGTQLTMGYVTNPVVTQNYINTIYSINGAGATVNAVINNNIIVDQVAFDADDNGIFQNNILELNGSNSISTFTGFTIRNN